MAAQYAFVMKNLTKTFPGANKPTLNNINLQFYQGAKIGIVGPNGAGKSSLLRIMAALDDGFTGDARLTPGFTVGYLDQEPQLDATKDVKGNVLDGVQDVSGGTAELVKVPQDELQASLDDVEADTAAQQ